MRERLFDLEEELDLDWRAEGEVDGADGGTGVTAGFAEDLLHEFARGVGDLGLGVKAGFAGDKDAEADDALDGVEIAHDGAQSGEAVEGALAGAVACGFLGDFAGHAALSDESAFAHRDLAADEDEVAGADGGDIGGDGFGRFGQRDAECRESCLGAAGRSDRSLFGHG